MSIFPMEVAEDCEKPSGPQNTMAAVTIATVISKTVKVVCVCLSPSMRNPLDKNECCAELGRCVRLMGSLHPHVDTTPACCGGNPSIDKLRFDFTPDLRA